MKLVTVQITYPVWADLVPGLALLIDKYDDVTRLTQHTRHGLHCFTLTMLQMPERRDRTDQQDADGIEGPPQHLNALELALHQRSIPHDIEQTGLEHPWRNTRSMACLRATPELSLQAFEDGPQHTPLWMTNSALGRLAHMSAACLLNPDPVAAAGELLVLQDVLHDVDALNASHMLIAAARMDRIESHLQPLTAQGLVLNEAVFTKALSALARCSEVPNITMLNVQEAYAARIYQSLARRLGVGQ